MKLNKDQIDVLTEIFNIGVGRAANALNELVDKKVHLEIPDINVITTNEANDEMKRFSDKKLSVIEHDFSCSFSGTASLAFPEGDAAKLVSFLTGEDVGGLDLDSVKSGTLTEVGNILINSLLGSISNILDEKMDFTLPLYREVFSKDLIINELEIDRLTIICKTKFTIEELEIDGIFFMYISSEAIEMLLAQLIGVE